MNTQLTERQQREIDYHREHSKEHKRILEVPFAWDVLQHPRRRWWNAYWRMYTYLLTYELKDKDVLVVGCGFGADALCLAKLGAKVSAFDLSPDSLQIANDLADREGFTIDFQEMPAERMQYADSSFDYILARDILHHVDIQLTINEIQRVARPNALLVVNEIYSHSFTNKIRNFYFVEKIIYPRMRSFIYGPGKPYITDDERKINEADIGIIKEILQQLEFLQYFNFIVTRILPDGFVLLEKFDQLLLRTFRPLGSLLAGRVLFGARIQKEAYPVESGSSTSCGWT